jgi:hypothetical protein
MFENMGHPRLLRMRFALAPRFRMKKTKQWRWRHNAWIGSMYGPVPVGLIFAGAVGLVGFAVTYALGWWS